MAVKKVVEVEIKTTEAKKNLDSLTATLLEQKQITIEFKKELALLEKQLRDTPKNSLAAQKELKDKIVGLKDAIKDQTLSMQELNLEKANQKANEVAIKGNEELGKSLVKNRGFLSAVNTLTGGLSNQVLGVGKSLSGAVTAVKSFNIGLSGMKKALIATGIGALVVALGTVIAYWDEIKAAISGVSIETSNLVSKQQRSVKESEQQLKLATSQDNILKKQGLSEVEIINYKRKQTAELIKQIRLQVELNKQATEEAAKSAAKWQGALNTIGLGGLAGFIGLDTGKIIKEGNESNQALEEQLNALLNIQAGYELEVATINTAASEKAKAKNEKDDKEREAKEKKAAEDLAKLKSDIKNAEANTEAELRAKELEDLRLHYDELILAAEAANLNTNELKVSQQEALIALQADFDAKDLDAAKKKADELKKLDDEKLANTKALAEAEAAIRDANINNVFQGFALLGQIAGKNKALQAAALIGESAVGIAKTVISTQAANVGALATPQAILTSGLSAIPVIAANKISAGIAIASNIAATAKGLSALKAGGSPKGGSISGGRGSSSSINIPESQAPAFNVVGTSGTNQLAQSIAGQNQQPIKAYVVSNDVSTAQSLDRNIVEGASI